MTPNFIRGARRTAGRHSKEAILAAVFETVEFKEAVCVKEPDKSTEAPVYASYVIRYLLRRSGEKGVNRFLEALAELEPGRAALTEPSSHLNN